MAEYEYTEDSHQGGGEQDSYVQQEVRKRPAENQSSGHDSKRRNQGPKKPTLKFLVPNLAVGKLIGKGGSNISELEKNYDASIEVSPSRDFFPGTGQRAVAVSAEIDNIISFTKQMVQDIHEEGERGGGGAGGRAEFILAISNSAIGFVMGRGGSVVKVIQEESGAGINIQKQNECASPGERLVSVSGSIDQVTKAVEDIIGKLSAEPHRMSNPMTKYANANAGGGGGDAGGYQMKYRDNQNDYQAPQQNRSADYRGGFNLTREPAGVGRYNDGGYNNMSEKEPMGYNSSQSDPSRNYSSRYDDNSRGGSYGGGGGGNPDYYEPKSKVKTTHFTTMEIPNAWVGSIVGKQGITINEFSRNSGAQISFSGKEEFAPGTQDRILTIKGSKSQIHRAYMMIDNKVAEIEQEFNRERRY